MRPMSLVRAWRAVTPLISRRQRWSLGVLAALGLAIGGLEALLFSCIGALVSLLDTGEATVSIPVLDEVSAGSLIAIGVSAAGVVVGLRLVEAHLVASIGIEPMLEVQRRLTRSYLAATWSRQQSEAAGRFQAMMTSHARRVGLIAYSLAGAISSIAIVVVLAATATAFHPGAFLALGAVVIVLVIVLLPIQRLVRRFGAIESADSLDYSATIAETVGASKELRIFAADAQRAGELEREGADLGSAIYRLKVASMVSPALYRSLVLVVLVVGLGYMTTGQFDDRASISAVAFLMVRTLMETQMLHSLNTLITEYLPFAAEIEEWLDRYRADAVVRGTERIGPVTSLEVDDISFAYGEHEPAVLNGVTLAVARGEKVGVVGPSGAGKSTLLAVIAGLLDPNGGTIRVNGHDITEITLESWSQQVSLVPQTPVLLTATVRENIGFHRDGIDDERICAAARAAGIAEDIEGWPQGYDTVIGDRGVRALSGGQRQRICIARALAGRPSLLLMDEPTSSLDRAAEDIISDTIGALGPDCAVLVISHRATALTACSRTVRIDPTDATPDAGSELEVDEGFDG